MMKCRHWRMRSTKSIGQLESPNSASNLQSAGTLTHGTLTHGAFAWVAQQMGPLAAQTMQATLPVSPALNQSTHSLGVLQL